LIYSYKKHPRHGLSNDADYSDAGMEVADQGFDQKVADLGGHSSAARPFSE
jgi:hypothetical protein